MHSSNTEAPVIELAAPTTSDFLDVIPQHELPWVRLEVPLPCQIRHVVDADVMPEERDRDDERNEAEAVVLDRRLQFGARGRIQQLFEVPGHMLQDIGMPAARRDDAECLHEAFDVAG